MRRAVALALIAGGASLPLAACSGTLRTPPARRLPPLLAGVGCSTAVAGAPGLPVPAVEARSVVAPFGIATTLNGHDAFVGGLHGITVFSVGGLVPRIVRRLAVKEQALGVSLTRDGRYLLAADGRDGAVVIDVARALAGAPRAVLGELTAGAAGAGSGAIELTTSPDGRFVFVSLANSRRIAVYDLRAALADGFRGSAYVGAIPVGRSPVGLAVSPSGRWLYSTSQGDLARRGRGGLLTVADARIAERDPARSVVAQVSAGCSPVRAVVSRDGRVVWVTARQSDRLLAFAANRLRTDPGRALIASVRVGEEPVGVALVDDGRRVVVADSNRFGDPAARAQLTVVAVAAALAHRPAILGTIRSGLFPREITVDPADGAMLVSNYSSGSLEAVRIGASGR